MEITDLQDLIAAELDGQLADTAGVGDPINVDTDFSGKTVPTEGLLLVGDPADLLPPPSGEVLHYDNWVDDGDGTGHFVIAERGIGNTTAQTWESGTDIGLAVSAKLFKNLPPQESAFNMGANPLNNVLSQNFTGATELTISTGEITITQTMHTVDTEADATTDDLDTINGGKRGDILYLRIANDNREVTIKHGVGNILTMDDGDYTLQNTNMMVKLFYDGSNWIVTNYKPLTSFVSVYLSTDTTITTDTNVKVNFDTVVADPLNEWDSTNYSYSPKQTGLYLVMLGQRGLSVPDYTMWEAKVFLNGSQETSFARIASSSGTEDVNPHGIIPLQLTPSDTIEGYARQDSGSSLTLLGHPVTTYFKIIRVS